jgi:hypothetical protein
MPNVIWEPVSRGSVPDFCRVREQWRSSSVWSNSSCLLLLQYTNIYPKTEPYQISVKPTRVAIHWTRIQIGTLSKPRQHSHKSPFSKRSVIQHTLRNTTFLWWLKLNVEHILWDKTLCRDWSLLGCFVLVRKEEHCAELEWRISEILLF